MLDNRKLSKDEELGFVKLIHSQLTELFVGNCFPS